MQAGLANNLMLSDRVEEALDIFQKLVGRRAARQLQLKLRIAEIYRVKHDYAKAAEALKKAKALNPQDMEVRYEEVKPAGGRRQVHRSDHRDERSWWTKPRSASTPRPKAESRAMMLQELGSLYRNNAAVSAGHRTVPRGRQAEQEPRASRCRSSTRIEPPKDTEGVRKEVDAAIAEMRTAGNGKNTRS